MKRKFEKINRENKALLATNFYNFETLKGVLSAAKDQNSPIILQLTKSSIDYMGLENAVSMAKTGLKSFGVEGWVHLDHGPSVELVEACLKAGFDSVMYDGSELPLEENIANTRKVVSMAKEYDVNVEAELGYIAKLGQAKDKVEYTRAEDALYFAQETGINTLAVAIGTAHGFYKERPKLDFERLKEIKEAVKIPLVLQGGSGVPVEDVRKAIKAHKDIKGIILDLRNNPGGLLSQAVGLVDLYVDKGVIVSQKGRAEGEDEVYKASSVDTIFNFPAGV